jgi:hypothetical protein
VAFLFVLRGIKGYRLSHFKHVEVVALSKQEQPAVNQYELVESWKENLPKTLEKADKARVWADEGDANALRVHITTSGHSGYTFDFKVSYVDSREVKVELVDVEQGQVHIDEHSGIVQTLIEDYVRHIHECAQTLQKVTHA